MLYNQWAKYLAVAWLLGALQLTYANPVKPSVEPLVIISGEWPPYVGEKLTNHGIIGELVSAVLQDMDARVSYKWLPWIRGEQLVEKGDYIATFPYAKTAQRNPRFHFSDPLFYTQTVFFYHTKHNPALRFERWSDLQSLRIGGVRGYGYVPSIQKKGLSLHLVNDARQLVKMLLRNRVDIIAINMRAGWQMIDQHFSESYSDFATLAKKVNERHSIHLMVSKKYPQSASFLVRFNRSLKELKESGAYAKVIQQTLPQKRN